MWSEKEILFLRENYVNEGAKYCSIKLKRTLYSVRRRAAILSLNPTYRKGNYGKIHIQLAVSKSESMTNVLQNMGLRAAGGNYAVLRKYIKLYGIDTSHFMTKAEVLRRMREKIIKKSLSEILINGNEKANSTNIKERLYAEGLKARKCELCGQDELWMGKKMSLIVDHKNGVHADWRLKNLQIVCPNCNATLDTHCGKNKKTRKCTKCDASIRHKGKFCRSCYGVHMQGKSRFHQRKVKNRPDEKQLWKDINELGYCGTGRKYGVSDNSIRKWIKAIK